MKFGFPQEKCNLDEIEIIFRIEKIEETFLLDKVNLLQCNILDFSQIPPWPGMRLTYEMQILSTWKRFLW